MSTPNTNPIWPGLTNKWMDVITLGLLLLLGVFVTYQSYNLGPGYGPQGPEPGFWPFWLAVLYMVGGTVALVLTIVNPDDKPFFEAKQEVIDLVSVGTPVLAVVLINYWLGV
ncbi:MAG: tripartite tricarboxylate transporter TctB family protein, partial [Halofilum sp. (in: g-proteobacteria)]